MSMIRNRKQGAGYVTVGADHENRRIDNFILRELKGIPRSRIYQMLRKGEIRVNGGRIRQGYRLKTGDEVRIPPVHSREEPRPARPGESLVRMVADSFIHEDDDIIVLNKPSGIVVHGGSGRSFGVIEILRFIRAEDADLQLVHRLDRETSGCLLIAKNTGTLRTLHELIRQGKIRKKYLALLKGRLERNIVEVDQPLQKNIALSGERMVAPDKHGKAALTKFTGNGEYPGATLVEAELFTGRTHQIRVHAAFLKHPIAGDAKYGNREFNRKMRQCGLKRLFLHASEIHIPPVQAKYNGLDINIALPDNLKTFLKKL